MIPIVCQPRTLSIRNRLRQWAHGKHELTRDVVVAAFTLIVTASILIGTEITLERLGRHTAVAYLEPSALLSIIFVSLCALLLFSNTIAALGSFYMGKDLELLLSSPVTHWKLFWGKFLEVLTSSTWMILVFGAPLIIGFGRHFDGGITFYLATIACLIPLFFIPTSIAICVVHLFSFLIPPKRSKHTLMVLSALVVIAMVLMYRSFAESRINQVGDINDVLQIISFMKFTAVDWTPSHWCAKFLGGFLQETPNPQYYFYLLLFLQLSPAFASRFCLADCCMKGHLPEHSQIAAQMLFRAGLAKQLFAASLHFFPPRNSP